MAIAVLGIALKNRNFLLNNFFNILNKTPVTTETKICFAESSFLKLFNTSLTW